MRSVLSIERELRRYAGAIQARSKALGTLRNNFLPKFVSRSRANKLAIKKKGRRA